MLNLIVKHDLGTFGAILEKNEQLFIPSSWPHCFQRLRQRRFNITPQEKLSRCSCRHLHFLSTRELCENVACLPIYNRRQFLKTIIFCIQKLKKCFASLFCICFQRLLCQKFKLLSLILPKLQRKKGFFKLFQNLKSQIFLEPFM